ncbi:MAG: metallophosphoesterase [Patescibacteria group bacterium]|nr:metallophosphoesterase [Patescibacteria group bacterium]
MKKFLVAIIFFLALASQAKAFSFAVIGDTQKFKTGKNDALRKTAKSISATGADFSFMLGDFCGSYKKCASKLLTWKKVAAPLFPSVCPVPNFWCGVYPTHGNHDAVGASDWQSAFDPPLNGPGGYVGWTYSFDYENSHFVVLDSNRSQWHLVDQTQRDWLEQYLAANTKENIFVFLHEPAFPVSEKIGSSLDANPASRDAFWEILDRYDVAAVFNGHEHIFTRRKIDSSVFPSAQNSIYQFTLGNTDAYSHPKPRRSVEYYYRKKSFLTVSVEEEQITVNLRAPEGNLLNSFTFLKSRSARKSSAEEGGRTINYQKTK